MTSRNNTQIKNKISKSLTEDKELVFKENKETQEIKNIKTNFIENNNNKMKKDVHPLDFYALGKVHDPPVYTSNFCPNKGFRSTSNDLLTRNIFSLNTYKYDDLKKNKYNSKLSLQNIDENNYLKPLEVFKTYKKYSLDSNVVNTGTYNIEKEKIFTKSNVSSIKKGLNITYSNFINYKNRLLTDNSTGNIHTSLKNKIKDKNLQRIKTETNVKFNNKSNEIANKFGLDNINNDNTINDTNGKNVNDIKLKKPTIKYVNPIDLTKKKLTSNFFYFDKNNQQFMRHKNWWVADK